MTDFSCITSSRVYSPLPFVNQKTSRPVNNCRGEGSRVKEEGHPQVESSRNRINSNPGVFDRGRTNTSLRAELVSGGGGGNGPAVVNLKGLSETLTGLDWHKTDSQRNDI